MKWIDSNGRLLIRTDTPARTPAFISSAYYIVQLLDNSLSVSQCILFYSSVTLHLHEPLVSVFSSWL